MSEFADRIIGHYERHAMAWDEDRSRGAWNDKPWLDRFIAMLAKGASVLDLGADRATRSRGIWQRKV